MRRVAARSISLLLLALFHSTLHPDRAGAWLTDPSHTQEVAPTQQQETLSAQEALIEQAQVSLDRLEEIQDTLTVMIALIEGGLSDDEVDLIRIGLTPVEEESRRLMQELGGLILRIEDAGGSVAEIRARMGDLLGWFFAASQTGLEQSFVELTGLAAAQDTSTAGGLADLAALGQEIRSRILSGGLGEIRVLDQAQDLGFDVTPECSGLDAILLDRTEALVGRLQLRVLERDRESTNYAEAQSADAGEEAIEQARRRVLDADERVEGAAATLDVVSDLLDLRGYSTAEYRQLVILATGAVTGDLFNPRVLVGLVRGWFTGGARWVRDSGPTILARLFLVLLTVWAFRVLFRFGWWLLRVVGIVRMPRLASDLLGRTLQPIATVLGLIVGLWTVGVDSTALLTGLGVFSLIVGLALQDSLSNFAAGLFILAHRPYDVDDVIETGGLLGRVVALGLANTTPLATLRMGTILPI